MSIPVALSVLAFLLTGAVVAYLLYRRVSAHNADALAAIPAARLYWLAAILFTSTAATGGLLIIWLVWGGATEVPSRLAHSGVALALWLLSGLFIPFFIVFRVSRPKLSLPALVGGAVSLSLAAYLTQYSTYRDLFGGIPAWLPLAAGWLSLVAGLGLLLAVLRWLRAAERDIW